jgi:uncharacterized protein
MKAGAWFTVLFLGTLFACSDPTGQPSVSLLQSESLHSNTFGDFADFDPLSSSASCLTPPASLPAFATYQPFVLPAGFAQEIILDEVTDFAPVAGSGANLPDMNTLNETGPQAGRFLYRTHEVGSNGAVTVTDLWTGITSLVVQRSHYEALDGIVWTPWGTLLFAEERVVTSFKDPSLPNAVGGLVYEWDPVARTSTPRPAIGARSHEGLRFDPQGNLYGISESTQGVNGSGAIYKFVPDRRGDLSSGQLYALKVFNPSRTGAAVWVPLDRQAIQVNSDNVAITAGATGWARPEDVEISMSTGNSAGGANVMYVAVTSEDLVLRVELDGDRAWVSNFVENVSGMTDPDNLALDSQGNLYIAEDRAAGDIWVARRTGGPERVASDVVRFASLSDCSAEPTGIYFDRSGKLLYVNVQHAGGALGNDLTVTIAREKR